MFGKASQSQTLNANEMLLEAPYLTDRVFPFTYLISKRFEKWNVFLPEQHAFYFIRSSCSALFTIIDGTRQSRWPAW